MMSDLTSGTQFPHDNRSRTNWNEFASTTKLAAEGRVSFFLLHLHQPAVGELLEEMALTGKLELCVGEGSAKGKPFLKELTTTNINGGKEK